MRELTQAHRVKSVLLESVARKDVESVAAYLSELDADIAWQTAAHALAIFDGDVDAAAYAVRKAMRDEPLWVQDEWQKWPHHTTFATMDVLLISHLLHVRDAQEHDHA